MPQIADNHRRSALPYCLLAMAASIAACQTARGQGFNLPGQQNAAGSQASDAGRANSASPQPTPSIPRTNLTPINSAPFNPAPRSTPTNPGSITAGQPTGTPQTFNPRPSGLPPVNTGGGYVASPAPASNPVIATPGNATAANTYPGGSFLGAIFNRNRSTQSPAFAPPTFGQNNFGTAGYPNTAPGIPGQNYGGQGFGAQPYGQSGYGVTVPPPAIGGTIPPSGIPGGFVAQNAPTFGGAQYPANQYPGNQDNGTLYPAPANPYASPGAINGNYGSPGFTPGPYASPSFTGNGGYPSNIYPSGQPNTMFPGGLFQGGGLLTPGGGGLNAYQLLRGPRFRYAFVGGGSGDDDLSSNDIDTSIAFAWPNFLYSPQPLYILPSFSLHLWDGPVTSPGRTADLPGSVYDAFLDFAWQSDPNQMFGAELGLRVGVFTDFDVMNSDSLRVMGKGLGSFRLTPASTLKLGVYYLDRNGVKLLPAGGLLWQPDPYTRFDIFFPEPKLAKYWRTVGTRDVWWYLSGDYGGGSWAIERANGTEDSVDVNDLRVMFGFEWGQSDLIRAGQRNAFFEFGYVFDREVEYKNNPADNFNPDDAFLFRIGIGY